MPPVPLPSPLLAGRQAGRIIAINKTRTQLKIEENQQISGRRSLSG
jgi:hypothetical protein